MTNMENMIRHQSNYRLYEYSLKYLTLSNYLDNCSDKAFMKAFTAQEIVSIKVVTLIRILCNTINHTMFSEGVLTPEDINRQYFFFRGSLPC